MAGNAFQCIVCRQQYGAGGPELGEQSFCAACVFEWSLCAKMVMPVSATDAERQARAHLCDVLCAPAPPTLAATHFV